MVSLRWWANATGTNNPNPADHHFGLHRKAGGIMTLDNAFTRTYELGREFGTKMQRLETVATLRKIIESANEHQKPILEAVLKAIEVEDE